MAKRRSCYALAGKILVTRIKVNNRLAKSRSSIWPTDQKITSAVILGKNIRRMAVAGAVARGASQHHAVIQNSSGSASAKEIGR